MDIKVSVIMPAYNAEKFVSYAVESVLAQTLSDIELIIVEDCSTDTTLAMLTERFGNNSKVRIIPQPENGGVSKARNRGIKEARGKYLAFLDSDDAMRPEMLEKMYAAAEAHRADVLHTTGFLVSTKKPIPDDISKLDPADYKPMILERCEKGGEVYYAPQDTDARLAEWNIHKYHWSVWNKLFCRSFIEENDIQFDMCSMAEDMVFCFKAFFLAKTYAVLPGQWYVYRISDGSLSRQKNTIQTIVKLTHNQILAAEAVSRFMMTTEYFIQHPAERVKVQQMVCDSVDRFYLVPALSQLTQEAVQESGAVTELFKQEYGEKGAFVEYLYWRMHELLKERIDIAGLESDFDELFTKTEDGSENK